MKEVAPRLEGKQGHERLQEAVAILDEMGYGASLDDKGNVHAVNCVFHQLARTTSAVCDYDSMVLRRLLGTEFDHVSCMRDGQAACVFAPH
jgi:predicted ArsR family transcriptional regulator